MKNFFKLTLLGIITLWFFGMSEVKVSAASNSNTFENKENGIITVTYNNTTNVKMKIGVTKDKQSYYYDLGHGKSKLDIPLNMGNGKYTIRILKNISGTKYSVVETTSIDLDLSDDNIVFLQSNVIVNFELSDKAIEKAKDLTQKCKSDAEIVSTIHNYVVKNFEYDYDKASTVSSGYLPDIEIIYKNKKGICYDISAIMAAMMRSQGVEVKLVTGYTPNIKGVYHAWNSVYDDSSGSWYTIDATYDIAMYRAKKKYTMKKDSKDYSDTKYQY
ncbi:MAG: transglutaminase domain-containing protein [Clostridiales bacterium]|nr:transglutaminase domain-containing protein [Clostridiales bacterium]